MIPSITSQTITANGSAAATTRPRSEELFNQLDSGGKGYLTQDDLVKISPKGAQAADSGKAEEAYKRMDVDGDGKVSQTEFKEAAPPEGPPEGPSAGQAKSAAGGKGAPQGAAGGAGGAGGAAKSGGGAASDIDPADANEDGVVSQQEQLNYDAEQKALKAASQSNTKIGDEAVKAYDAVAQAGDS